ncbi:MAG: tetratricopeptide repeat protein [Gemmataceae bacterium]|nr:tetratricopeptide repeat protein [Gemmataceae bacterium]
MTPRDTDDPPKTANATGVYEPSAEETNREAVDRARAAQPLPSIPGYDVEYEVARGGMGCVYAARDRVLDRDVAIKTLLARANAERFVVESKIAAQLQHPGIPPVHALGTLDDGTPYLVMKLIRGRTLAALMKDPEWDRSSFGSIFESIAQAVAAAHERRIIHRDLKPSNVMVGAFGETQVMDWGLAKRLGDAETGAGEAEGATAAQATVAGHAMGTPAYMPPEQARGEIERIDERADVFGLGAILCALLTGHPPFSGNTVRDTIARAVAGDLSDADRRLDACGADPEWTRLARHCLRADPAERPRNAGEVARMVREIRVAADERARRAELERVRLESERHADARRRRVRRALVGSLVALVAVAAGAAWIVREQRYERQRQAERATLAIRSTLDRLPDYFARSLWTDALGALDDGERVLGADADPALRDRIAHARAEATFLKELEEIRLLKATFKDFNFVEDDARKRYESAFAATTAFGSPPFDLFGAGRAETAARLRASPIRDHVIAALDDWAFMQGDPVKSKALFQITADVTGQDWRRDLPPTEYDPIALKKRLDAVPVAERTPALIGQLGRMIDLSGGDGVGVILAGLTRYPNDFWLHMYHAFTAKTAPAQAAAVRAALALRPDTFGAHVLLASVLLDGREATPETHRQALAVAERLVRLWPDEALSHNYLGGAHGRLGHHAAAEHHYRKAVELEKGRIAHMHWNGLAIVLRNAGKWEAALEAARSGLAVGPPTDAYLPVNAADTLLVLGRANEAIDHYRMAIRRGFAGAGPHAGLAAALLSLGQPAEAEAHFRRAETHANVANNYQFLAQSIASRSPNSPVAKALTDRAARLVPDPASPSQRIAQLKAQGKRAEIRTLVGELFQREPNNFQAAYEYGAFHFEERNYAEAVRGYGRFAELRPDICAAHCNLGASLVQLKRYDDAIKSYEKAVEVDPKDAGARFWLANVYRLANRPQDALASVRKSLELNGDDPMARELLKVLEAETKKR